jgi:hypothetical protein
MTIFFFFFAFFGSIINGSSFATETLGDPKGNFQGGFWGLRAA